MSSRTLLLIPLLAAVAACGPAVTITRDASLPIYPRTTYTWGVADAVRQAGRGMAPVDDSVRSRVERAVDAELALRGFRKTAFEQAQLVVHYHIGVTRKVELLPITPACAGRPCNEPPMDWGYWGAPEPPIREVPYTEGSLMLDFLSRPGLALAWRGVIVGEVTDKSSSEAAIRRGVAQLLKRFPSD